MERQKSLSIKPTRFLVFSFTISSSLIFFTFFSAWVFKFTTSFSPETHLQFNKSSLSLGMLMAPVTVQTFTDFSVNFSSGGVKIPDLIDTHFRETENVSGFGSISVFERIQREKTEPQVLEDETDKGCGVECNLTIVQGSVPGSSLDKIEIPSSEKIEEKKSKLTSFEHIEVPRSDKIKEKKNKATSFERIEVPRRVRECDLTKGRWVYDESYPMYTNASCPFIDEGFNCEGNGRLDKDYMKWRWQPQDCEIPRFNATKMLDLIRGKRLVFVGDSINRNQWESMLCMLMQAIRDPRKVYETHGRRITKGKGNYSFKFVDYKCTVEYYVTHFLVHESKARIGQKRKPTLRIDAIDRGSSRWRGADVLIFNTAHWWTHFKTKSGINYYQEGDQVHPQLDVSIAFRRALMTWASWVDKHINPIKTKVFFRTSSPSHFRGGQWNSGGHCKGVTQPFHGGMLSNSMPEKNIIAGEVIKQMKTPVTFLNITSLSENRVDGHPSIYGRKSGKGYSASVQDCSHWCLPGVPDTWNDLVYYFLQSKQHKKFH